MAETQAGQHLRNLDENPQPGTAGVASVAKILLTNTTGVTVFVQMFDAAAADIILGTTIPLLQIPLPATTGAEDLDFDPPWLINRQLTLYATTDSEGNTGAVDGVFAQIFEV